ncbi:NAD-dependent epimerase/dehydratase family protein [Pseudomonas sp. Q1-7]|uniref:NAD-dependent epimerase/dehydratase family protein n=1 Tax=Pseudomonas sp. Q1-7 TaxID=3020843 RepID=UPI002301C784|nr:NAD-dependent epimerase/dehydratase family protein [Pseudomonas sp. Q1-7]
MFKKKVICVTGASGFIGSHLMPLLLDNHEFTVRTLRRRLPVNKLDNDEVYLGDLTEPGTLSAFLEGGDIVIHLAQPAWGCEGDVKPSDCSELAMACRAAGVKRFLYVSTATVVGNTDAVIVNESTPCEPRNNYERQKFNCELALRKGLGEDVDLGILRPTAVFGPNGKNLVKLARVILYSTDWRRIILRFLHGRRSMHLISVENVVASVVFLVSCERALDGNVFILSDDHNEKNHYQAIDRLLANAAGRRGTVFDVAIPAWLLRVLLALMGRSQTNPELRYDCSKIVSWGFRHKVHLEESVEGFMRWYISNQGGKR